MSGIFKSARWDFVDGPLENHLGFVGEDVGGCVGAIEVEFKRGEYARYEKTGQGVEEVFDGSERVFYSMRHVPRPNVKVGSGLEALEPHALFGFICFCGVPSGPDSVVTSGFDLTPVGK